MFALLRAAAIVVAFAATGRWLATGRWSPVTRYVVEGPSMEPAYRARDRVVVNRVAYRFRPPRVGDVVVVRDPDDRNRFLLKRVAVAPDRVLAPEWIYLLGDNAQASRDSRAFGPVRRSEVVGRAWFTY
jgi:signal peptidase I